MPDESAAAKERPSLETFAGLLITHEAQSRQAGGSEAPDAFQIFEKLRAPLATLMGSTGYHALLSRALMVAGREAPWVGNVQVKAGGTLALRAAAAPATPQDVAAGSTVLVLTLFGLLVAFIGEQLTLRLVREVWPDLSADDLEPRTGDKP